MTERLIPFDLDAAKADPSRVWHKDGYKPQLVHILPDGCIAIKWVQTWDIYEAESFKYLLLTAPAPKRVEVRAALWGDGSVSVHPQTEDVFIMAFGSGFVRWLTNWHIEDGKVFVEVE